MADTMAVAIPHRRRMRQQTRHTINGILFASPWLLGLLMFWIYPTLASAYYSFTKFNAVQAPQWIGLTNYINLFTNDMDFRAAVYNTLYFAIVSIPLAITPGFFPGLDAERQSQGTGRLSHDLLPAHPGARGSPGDGLDLSVHAGFRAWSTYLSSGLASTACAG